MPIVDIQRRFRELGRLRIGIKVPVMRDGRPVIKDGRPVMRPTKLATWRLTSPWRHLLDAALELGIAGEVRPWVPDEGREEYELVTDTNVLEVLVPPGEVLSQWWEAWQGGGLVRRCDGVRMVTNAGKSADRACLCPPDGERPCKPTTRLLVMLPGLPDLGVWRLESHGFNAAVELGGAVAITELATARGVIIPAELRIEARQVKRAGEPIKRFGVPVLGFRHRLGDTLEALGFGATDGLALIAGAGPIGGRPALDEGGTPALPHGDPDEAPVGPERLEPVEEATLPPARGGVATEARTGDAEVIDVDAELEEEPAVFVPPALDPNAEAERATGGRAYTSAQVIAMRAGDLEISDDVRHAVIGVVSRGKTRSGKELAADQVTRALKVLDGIGSGAITVTEDAGTYTLTDTNGVRFRINVDDSVERLDEAGTP
jgi:hypothetical protein